jgi:site-specific DNA-methyltransferase (adenine-specific)
MGSYVVASALRHDIKVRNKPAKRAVRLGCAAPAPLTLVGATPAASTATLALALNEIVVGDSEQVMALWPSESIDLIVTSPPYNFGMEYHKNGDTAQWNEYFDKLHKVFAQCARVLVPGGRMAVNVQPLFSDYMPTHHMIANILREVGLLFKAELLWEKHNYNCKYTAWGSWRSPSMPYFKYTWEFIEVFCKMAQKKVPRQPDATSDISGEEFKKWVYAKWDIAPERAMKAYNHPAMFPEEMAARLVKMFSYPGDIVVDPFNGAGTTCVVARRLGRQYIGIDIAEEYCRTARRRLAQAQPELAL